MRLLPILALLGALLSGCVSAPADVTGASAPAPAGDLDPAEAVVLVDLGRVGGVPPGSEFDVLCRFGGGPELQRVEDARILPGVAQLAVHVTTPPTSTGLQVGYAIDNEKVQWLPVARPGGATSFVVDVPPDAHEENGTRWAFFQQHNVSLAPQDCYTGGSALGWHVRVETAPPGQRG